MYAVQWSNLLMGRRQDKGMLATHVVRLTCLTSFARMGIASSRFWKVLPCT